MTKINICLDNFRDQIHFFFGRWTARTLSGRKRIEFRRDLIAIKLQIPTDEYGFII